MDTFRKSNIVNSFIIGEIIAISLILISKNLKITTVPAIDVIRSDWLALIIFLPVLISLAVYGAFLLGRIQPVFFEFGKLLVIGLSNAIIDFGVLNLLILLTYIERGHYFSLFKGLSSIAAIVNSYLWNKVWAFEGSEGEWKKKEFLQFVVVSFIGVIINVVVASLVVNVMGPIGEIPPRVWANFGAFFAIVMGGLWNFLGYKFIVFSE